MTHIAIARRSCVHNNKLDCPRLFVLNLVKHTGAEGEIEINR